MKADRDLEHYKQLARQANAAGDHYTVGMIIAKRLEPLFGDNQSLSRYLCPLGENEGVWLEFHGHLLLAPGCQKWFRAAAANVSSLRRN